MWKNISKDGNKFRAISLRWGFKKDREWQNTNSLGVFDIEKAIEVLQQAKAFIEGNGQAETA